MLKAVSLGLLATVLLAPSGVSAPEAARGTAVDPVSGPDIIVGGIPAVVELAHTAGTGCPPGTAAVAVSPDGTELELRFQAYMALVGVGAKATDVRKNCQLVLKLHHPVEYSYAIAQADYHGHATLERGASATQRANYYFAGQPPTTMMSHTFTGPMDDDWQSSDVMDIASLLFSPCGQDASLNINTEIRVNAGSSDPRTTTSLMTLDSASTDTYSMIWRTCD